MVLHLYLSLIHIFSKAAYEKYGDEYGSSADKVVGTGPYVITDWKENEYVKFEAREDSVSYTHLGG